MAGRRLACAVLALALLQGGCGRGETSDDEAAPGTAPAGLWTLDREALLAAVRRRHGREGGEELAREEAQVRDLEVDLELRADGRYGMRTRALEIEQRCVGLWRLERGALQFRRQVVDGKQVTGEPLEVARYVDDRILLPFDAIGLTFVLVRR